MTNDFTAYEASRDLETAIAEERADDARTALIRWLTVRATSNVEAVDVGELLAEYAKNPLENADVAALAIRCAFVRGLLEPNATNQIVRSVVQLAEVALPEFVGFLKIDRKQQNFEKFQILAQAHRSVREILSPFRTPYGDLSAVVASRKAIVGSLAHNPIRGYLSAFGLEEVRRAVEDVFGRLSRVARAEETLVDDVEESQRSIAEAFELAESIGSFLSLEYLLPLLRTVERALATFVSQMRARFSAIIKPAFDGEQISKRYPLHETGRDIQISVPMRNLGPGGALDVRVTCTLVAGSVALDTMTMSLGSVAQGEFEVAFQTLVVAPCEEFRFLLSIEWGIISSPQRLNDLFEFTVAAQSTGIDWAALGLKSPYSDQVAEGDKFLGRQDRVRGLAGKILRSPMEPFYVTGQKRVGKTSLAKAAVEVAVSEAAGCTVHPHYILWGEVAHADPSVAMRKLGTSIEDFIASELPAGVAVSPGDYAGSLSDLLRIARLAEKASPNKRFVVTLDEFDDIHEKLYLRGELAAAFFANLRALSRARNICLVLVGGENMPYIMERQGQSLNNFSRINLNYYDRGTEWQDFILLIEAPTSGVLRWHEEAIAEVYNITSGNPYFAKQICGNVFSKAITERDADITASEVRTAAAAAVSSLGAHHFSHFWQDGIPKAIEEREPDWLRRMRVLVAFARCLRNKQEATPANIAENKAAPALSDTEVPPVLNDFTRRGILREDAGRYIISLPIFRMWLVDIGVSELVADALSEEIAGTVLAQENSALVKAEEIVELVNSWPTYCGRRIGTDDVRAWLEQVDSKMDQRLLFQLLQRLKVYGESIIRERLKGLHIGVRQVLPIFVRKSPSDRRQDVVITYLDGPAKSGASYAALYAEENQILASQVITPQSFATEIDKRKSRGEKIAAVVVVDDIAATGGTLAKELEDFITDHQARLRETKLRALVLAATIEAQSSILERFRKFDELDLDFRASEVLTASDRAFSVDGTGWQTAEQFERAKALCRDLGSRIYRNHPFGYGDLGLLVVFPTTVPNNTLPIIHSRSKGGAKPWKPLFLRPVN